MVAKLVMWPEVDCENGEDLYIHFECTGDGTEFEVVPKDGNLYWNLDQDDETGETVGLSCKTEHYGLSWSSTVADVLKLALSLGLGDRSTWEWYGAASEQPKLRWKRCFRALQSS